MIPLTRVVTVAMPTPWLAGTTIERLCSFSGSPTAIMLFEAAQLLRKYPVFNAFYAHSRAMHHVMRKSTLALQLAPGRGVEFPVLRRADTKSLPRRGIANEMRGLLLSCLDNKLGVDSLAGGTFTITDLSAEGAFSLFPSAYQPRSIGHFRSWRGFFLGW